MTDMIRFDNFSFRYDAQAQPTLKNINLTIKKGEKVLILGPSGSGKSTLAQLINGIIPNTYKGEHSGRFLINGQDAFDLSIYEKSQMVSTVLQDTDGQFIGLSVAEDMAFALENDALPQADMVEKVTKWAQKLDLLAFLDHRPQDLSGGQKQRVSLAGVLIDESPILLFDEPLANLDPKTGQDTVALIDQIHQESEVTTIIVEHRLEDVMHRPIDRVVLLNDGQLIFDGQLDDLLATDLLIANGIREPLYLSVLRQLGLDLTRQKHLSDLEQLDLSGVSFHKQDLSPVDPIQGDTLLEVQGLSVAYQPQPPVLSQVSFNIDQGQRLAIVGKNGAGKSSLAKALTGFIPSQASLKWQHQDISQDSIKERAERIGYVLQNPNHMISQALVYDEVAKGLRLRGLAEEEIEPYVHQVLKTCGLYSFRKWPISALSYGQKKRVTIASILVLNPDIILLDEPTAGQDLHHSSEIMAFLDELNQAGHTIVMITHDMQLMLDYCDRCLVVADGTILADQAPIQVLSDPELLRAANLKETSLFELAKRLKDSPQALSHYYKTQVLGGHHDR